MERIQVVDGVTERDDGFFTVAAKAASGPVELTFSHFALSRLAQILRSNPTFEGGPYAGDEHPY